jgi:molybdate-binding protein/DNA-binding XRE family transcriptional regulator
MSADIENHLGRLRERRGVAVADLAKLAGVRRQTIYAIEAGSYVPNTALALKLARVLEATVEEIFSIPGDLPAPELRSERVKLLPGSGRLQAGQPVQLCRVDRQIIASPPSPAPWYFPPSDAIMAGPAKVRVLHPGENLGNRLLVAGCDPAISVLARHVQAAGVELVLAHRNSTRALDLLKQGLAHVAGTHLRDERSGESNLPEIGRRFPKKTIAVISFAIWEEGIVTAHANPKAIRSVEDLARGDVQIVNREAGSGARRLLDTRLTQLGIDAGKVRGYAAEALGHLPASWQVQTGAVDCCIATRAAARLFGLGFVPLASERYDLAIRRRDLDSAPVQALLDALNRARFRRELDSLGGYDTHSAGERML